MRALERLIAPLLDEIEVLIDGVLHDAAIGPDEIVEVVYTGGSSAIPAVRALVHRVLPGARGKDAAAFTSVAAGLALPGVEESVAAAR